MKEIIKNKKISFGQRWCILLIAGLVATLVLFNSPNFALNSVVFGYGGGGYPVPTPPTGGFRVVINGGAATTSSRIVTLNFSVGSDITQMMISNSSNFVGALQESYVSPKTWILSGGDGIKTVYVKFYNKWSQSSEVVSDTIVYAIAVVRKLSPAAQKVDINNDDKIDILDFNALMVSWGSAAVGSLADFNGDNKVDIFDFNLLMINWIG